MIVAKFGGSSLADAGQIRKVMRIVLGNPERRVIVVSAPGKRNPKDEKVTDLLYKWHRLVKAGNAYKEVMDTIERRFSEIVSDLGLRLDVRGEISEIERAINHWASADYAASRGEYLNAKILAKALDYVFIDPITCIRFGHDGNYAKNNPLIKSVIGDRAVVVAGFYGLTHDRRIKTFSRGGSDITGALVARALRASVYENWTDVSGLLMADPKVVNKPKTICRVTYGELRELSYMGAEVFHSEAMFPVKEVGIPTNIRNTNSPRHCGTMIMTEIESEDESQIVTGIAGRKHFTFITVGKTMLNQEIGSARKVLSVLEAHGISFEHMPGGIDSLSLIIDSRFLTGKLKLVIEEIREAIHPEAVKVLKGMALVAVVGRGMVSKHGIASRIFTATAKARINVRMINQGSSELSVIIGVDSDDYENTVRAIYAEFA